MKTLPTEAKIANRLHQRYQANFVGNGATTVFFLAKSVGRLEDLQVFVDGVRQRPSERGVAHDFKVRGITGGYPGDSNAIKLSVAPIAGADVLIELDAT